MDDANLINPDVRGVMNVGLETLVAQGGRQIVVATEPRLKGATIADDLLALARGWRLGSAGKNDGVLLLIVESEKRARIEVGYGLEGQLTDAASRLIIDDRMEAHLRAGEWTEAAQGGLGGLLAILHPAPVDETPSLGYSIGQAAGMLLFGVVIVLIALGIVQGVALAIPGVAPRLAKSKRWGWIARWRVLGGSGRGGSDNSSSGGGGGGGGGGGSFGGGGASD